MFEADTEMSITTLADELAVAVSHGLIRPHVQSVIDLKTGALVGYQGLARWEHPQHGLLDADQFVHVVASTPILPVIDLAVLRRTAAAAARRRRGTEFACTRTATCRAGCSATVDVERYLGEIIDDLGLAPRISASRSRIPWSRDLRARSGARSGLCATSACGSCSPVSTASARSTRSSSTASTSSGWSGASSTTPDATRPAGSVAHGTIALARALGLTVIAVGIENEADLDDLRDAGCDYGEGYLLGAVRAAGTVDS